MSSNLNFRVSGSKKRFLDLVEKHQTMNAPRHNNVLPDRFSLRQVRPFVDGSIDILDILAYRDKLNRMQ